MASPSPGIRFSLIAPSTNNKFSPRLGSLLLLRDRAQNSPQISIPTPGILTSTSRGVIPHLSRDHQNLTSAVKWVHIPFESFLEHNPPVPTMQKGTEKHPMHRFLGYLPSKHVVSMSIRDPDDAREMPTNGNDHISANCLRGVRKVSPTDWRSYTLACKPDLVVALSDTPYINPPYSQKRLTKSIQRSAAWLATLLRPPPDPSDTNAAVLVHMAGLASIPARRAFAESLLEQLHDAEAEAVKPHKCLDAGVTGYTFDLVPIRLALGSNPSSPLISNSPSSTSNSNEAQNPSISTLLQTSLRPLPHDKLRIVNSTRSPHEVLDLISTVGIDVFDAGWAQRAAAVGVALDFRFPVRRDSRLGVVDGVGNSKKLDLGHNLYSSQYPFDFSQLADTFCGSSQAQPHSDKDVCPCGACSPVRPPEMECIVHDTIDLATSITTDSATSSSTPSPSSPVQYEPPFTRAYIHHLLHTHEMSAHALLVVHNLTVVEAFFEGVREVLRGSGHAVLDHDSIDGTEKEYDWIHEVDLFNAAYDGSLRVVDDAMEMWKDVDLARGKGRLGREKKKEKEKQEQGDNEDEV